MILGDICRSGTYCVSGSSVEEPCDAGYYQPNPGAQAFSDCVICTAGFYCGETGLSVVSGPCTAGNMMTINLLDHCVCYLLLSTYSIRFSISGYYCPDGQVTSTPGASPCPVGHYCPVGSASPTICLSGYYQGQVMQDECLDCPEGYYCDNSIEPISDYSGYTCPEGIYCVCC